MDSYNLVDLEILKSQSMFTDLTEDQLGIILTLMEKEQYEANETIIAEEEEKTDLYFIVEGEVKILKLDDEGLFNLTLGKLKTGDMFGEMSFVDSSPRSSTIDTTKTTTVFKLARDKLDKTLPEIQNIYNTLVRNIATININRLRVSNAANVKSLRTYLRKFQFRQIRGKLLISLFLICGVLNFFFSYFNKELEKIGPDLFIWVYWWIFGLLSLFAIKKLHIYRDEFGWTLENLTKTIYSSTGIVILGGLFLTIFPSFSSETSMQPIGPAWLAGYLLFCSIYEFVGRGAIIAPFKKFFEDEKGWISILVSACFLSALPYTSYLQLDNGIFINFLLNLAMGLIFLKQGNLFGVIFIHFILGTYMRYLNLV